MNMEARLAALDREIRASIRRREAGRVSLGVPDDEGFWYAPAGTTGAELDRARRLWIAWWEASTPAEWEPIGKGLQDLGCTYVPRSAYFDEAR